MVVAAFKQEKALVGAFSVIVQLHRARAPVVSASAASRRVDSKSVKVWGAVLQLTPREAALDSWLDAIWDTNICSTDQRPEQYQQLSSAGTCMASIIFGDFYSYSSIYVFKLDTKCILTCKWTVIIDRSRYLLLLESQTTVNYHADNKQQLTIATIYYRPNQSYADADGVEW